MKTVHAAGVLFTGEDGSVLVLKRHGSKHEGNRWGPVGGKVESGENKSAALIREIKEEIDYQVDPRKLEFIKTYYWDQADRKVIFELYSYYISTKDLKINLKLDEHTEYKWQQPAELYKDETLMLGMYPILEDLIA
jgi:8-oxo-dGTP diphosphatase